jgi:hypothetical protein
MRDLTDDEQAAENAAWRAYLSSGRAQETVTAFPAGWQAGRDYAASAAAAQLEAAKAGALEDNSRIRDLVEAASAAAAREKALMEHAELARSRALLLDGWSDIPALQDDILYFLGLILGPLPGDAAAPPAFLED